jgi:nitrogen-specific signal transduction histidine kinase
VVRLFNNPFMMRSAVVFFFAATAFVLALMMIRALRKSIAADAEIDSAAAPKLENLPMHLYNTVIQQLKQQKHELQVQTLAEQRRARTTENFSQTVLSNLSSGVLVFGTNGLVKQANPAAKQILGFSSPGSMSAADIFRNAQVCSSAGMNAGQSPVCLRDEIDAVLHHGSKSRQLEADYTTPAGKPLRIAVTVSPVPAVDGGLLGATCLISDRSEFEQLLHQQELQGEMSAEMALELRTSLATITGYAQQLARSRDAESAGRLAEDIAGEAARLERHLGGFLAAKRAAASTLS